MGRILVFMTLLAAALPAHAYFSTLSTADALEQDQYEAGFEMQYILNKIAGANFIGHFNMGMGKGRELDFLLGTGSTNFQLGAFFKTNPIPDVAGQPGISVMAGSIYANKDGAYTWSFRLHPIISEKFKLTEKTYITPYLTLPLGVTFSSVSTTVPIQLAFGAEWLPDFFSNIRIMGEAGFEINSSFSYYTVALKIPFDSSGDIKAE